MLRDLASVKNPAGVKEFGKRLQSLREAKGYSQQALADIANVEKSTIKRIEQAHYSPTLDVLISLARALDIELSVLMDVPGVTRADSDLQ